MFSLRNCILFLGLTVVCGSTAHADTIAYTITDTTSHFNTGDVTAGFKFTTNAAIVVTKLGVFDDSQDGLGDSHMIGIWNSGSGGAPLVMGTVPSGPASPLTNQFRYVSIAPTLLAAGQSYDIGEFHPTMADNTVSPASGFATDPNITFMGNRIAELTSFFRDPTSTLGRDFDPGFFGPNFQFTTSAPVPEPSTFALLGIGTLGLAGYAWKRRKQIL